MKLPFVSRGKYEELKGYVIELERDIREINKKSNKQSTIIADYEITITDLNVKLNGKTKELDEINKKIQKNKKLSESAIAFNKRKRDKEKEGFMKEMRRITQMNAELQNMNNNLVQEKRELEKHLNQLQNTVIELDKALNGKKNRPTVEELKYEKPRVEKHKLAGKKKQEMKKD